MMSLQKSNTTPWVATSTSQSSLSRSRQQQASARTLLTGFSLPLAHQTAWGWLACQQLS